MSKPQSLYIPRTEVQILLGLNLQAMKRIEKQGSLTPIKLINKPHAKVYYQRKQFDTYLDSLNNPQVA